jgi:hypothetical protein
VRPVLLVIREVRASSLCCPRRFIAQRGELRGHFWLRRPLCSVVACRGSVPKGRLIGGFDVERRKRGANSDRTLHEGRDLLRQSPDRAERAEQENLVLRGRAERVEQENLVLRERAERAERAARALRAEELARSLPLPKRAARRPKTASQDRWKLPKYQHWFNILQGIYKLLVKGAIPLNDPSIENKEIARLLKEHDLLQPLPQPRGDLVRRVALPRGPTLERRVGEAIAHSGRMFHAPGLSKDEVRALTFAQLSETAAHVRSLQSK